MSTKTHHGNLSEALAKHGVDLSQAQIDNLTALSNKLQPLGVGINTDITVQIAGGKGQASYSATTFWQTITGTLSIASPTSSDVWNVVAYDAYSGNTIFNGTVTYGQQVPVNYKTGFKIDLNVTVQNLTNPAFTGALVIHANLSV